LLAVPPAPFIGLASSWRLTTCHEATSDGIRVIRSLFPRFAVPSDADYKQHKAENQTQRGGHVTQFHNEFLPRRAARRTSLPGCERATAGLCPTRH
jgi:hypothetical protein